jgi:hypothetical protein
MRLHLLAATAIFLPTLLFSQRRVWTDQDGRTVEAEYRALAGEKVQMILRNGRLAEVLISTLSEADQGWIRQQNSLLPAPSKPDTRVPKSPVAPLRPKPAKPDVKVIKWDGLNDLGTAAPDLPPVSEPSADALIAVNDWIGKDYFYMRPDGSDAFPDLDIDNRIKPFSEGLAWVETKETKGYINREGKFVIGGNSGTALPDEGSGFGEFKGGRALFSAGRFSGFLDKKGSVVVAANKYRRVENFSDGLAAVNSSKEFGQGIWHYINPEGKVVIPGPWFGARPFRDGVAWVAIDKSKEIRYIGRYRLINKKCESVLGESTYSSSDTQTLFAAGYCRTGDQIIRPDGSVHLHDTEDFYVWTIPGGPPIATASIRGANSFRLVHLPSKSVYGPIISGSLRFPFEEGLASFMVNSTNMNKYGCIDRSGQIVIQPKFFEAPRFKDGYAVVRRAFGESVDTIRIVVIDRKGEIIHKGKGR